METLFVLIGFLLCVGLPIVLMVAFIRWLWNRGNTPTVDRVGVLTVLEALLARWQTEGRISAAAADEVRALLAAERTNLSAPVAAPAQPAPPQPTAAPLSAPATVVLSPDDVPAPEAPATAVPLAQEAPAAGVAMPAGPAIPAGPTLGDRFGQALLALRTRQTLLFLGAFLLFISALILIVFNWASFSPILQFALIAGVCGSFWAGGAWLIRNTDLDRAGAGLQAVGGVLVPVVAFSLSRPGLLDLAPRWGWLLASLLCVPIYAFAAWRLRRPIYSGAACVSVASAVLAAMNGVDVAWLPAVLLLTLAAFLPLEQWLVSRVPTLAAGPRWVAHVGAPLALLAAVLLVEFDPSRPALAGALWAGAGFYALALVLKPRQLWAWVAAALPLVALVATLLAWSPALLWWAVCPALLGLAYTGLALALEPRARARVLPAYLGALALATLAIASSALDMSAARWALPLLFMHAVLLVVARERGRLAWLAESSRDLVVAVAFGGAALLLAGWFCALLDLSPWQPAEIAMVLQVFAALGVVAASIPRLRRSYDLALQVASIAVGLIAMFAAATSNSLQAAALTGFAALAVFEALRYRNIAWAAVALGVAALAAQFWLQRFVPDTGPELLVVPALLVSALYLEGGALLRRSVWRYWSLPMLGWGALASLYALMLISESLFSPGPTQPSHVLALLVLAAIVALASALWRAAWPGAIVALLLSGATLLAAERGFFIGWQLETMYFGLIICALTLGFVLLGQGLRRVAARYAWPYEFVGYALLTFAFLPTFRDARAATLTWTSMLALYTLARWLYRRRWATLPALLVLDMALLSGASWLVPDGRSAGSAVILLGAAWFQGVLALWAARGTPLRAAPDLKYIQPAGVVAFVSSSAALMIASRTDDVLAIVGFGLAALLALWATLRRNDIPAWSALLFLGIGLAAAHRFFGLDPRWSMAWGVAEALALCVLGWALDFFRARQAGDSPLAVWSAPLSYGPLAVGVLLTAALASNVLQSTSLPPLTFALATLALICATTAAQRRRSEYAYAAAGALVLAGLCQLYDWGFREPQWFVLPAGLYLLALAVCIRRFQQDRHAAQLLEAGALTLMLGVSFGQSLRAEGLESQAYAAWLCAEALLLLGYGVLAKLRAPFIGGVAFFVMGVLWLSADPLMALNKWVLLGLLGLLLVGAYLLLERRQQELVRAGRALIETVSSWS